MMERFSSWFRENMLTHDGRVVWWEHAYVFLVVFTAVGYPLGRWVFHSAWVLALSTALALMAGTYSYWQDLVLNRDRVAPVADKDKVVPLQTRVYAVFFVCALVFAWWTLAML